MSGVVGHGREKRDRERGGRGVRKVKEEEREGKKGKEGDLLEGRKRARERGRETQIEGRTLRETDRESEMH